MRSYQTVKFRLGSEKHFFETCSEFLYVKCSFRYDRHHVHSVDYSVIINEQRKCCVGSKGHPEDIFSRAKDPRLLLQTKNRWRLTSITLNSRDPIANYRLPSHFIYWHTFRLSSYV